MQLPLESPDSPYHITYYERDCDRLIVVFSGGIFTAKGSFPEQFKSSLARYDCATMYVHEHPVRVFKSFHAPPMFARVTEIARRYKHVSTLGESMGAIGALLLGGLCPNVDRVLALSAPYSGAEPFVMFDPRYGIAGSTTEARPYWLFSSPAVRPKTQLLYSNTDWADTVHASMFMGEGYDVSFVAGGGHLLASYLKNGTELNLLDAVLRPLADSRAKFDRGAMREALGAQFRYHADPVASNFETVMRLHAETGRNAAAQEAMVNIAKGRKTDQSSVSEWSRKPTTEGDSAMAVSGVLTGAYAFHTEREFRPWWRVDLGAPAAVDEVRIYNRIDDATVVDRGVRFAIEASDDGDAWREVFVKNDGARFGSLNSRPFRWRPEPALATRHLRIRLLVEEYMHYEQIEVYGRYTEDAPP